MSIIRLALLVANTAQTIAWGKEVVQSEKGQKVINKAKEKSSNVKDTARASAAMAAYVAGEVVSGVNEKTKPAREAIVDKLNKATNQINKAIEKNEKETIENESIVPDIKSKMPEAKDEW